MKILALDTATEACSVALFAHGDITHHYEVAPQQHVRQLLPAINRLLNAARIKPLELDGVAFGRGPGSFTGVRIAVSAAQAIGFATGCPLVPVSTLSAMAHRAYREHAINYCLPMIDARMEQVYWSACTTHELGKTESQSTEQVRVPATISRDDLPQSGKDGWSGVGTGYSAYTDVLRANGIEGLQEPTAVLPAAIDVLHLSLERFRTADTVTAEQAMPVYLRDKVANTEAERAVHAATQQTDNTRG